MDRIDAQAAAADRQAKLAFLADATADLTHDLDYERTLRAVAEAAAHAADGTTPPEDLGGKADYRRHLAQVLTRRAVMKAAGLSPAA